MNMKITIASIALAALLPLAACGGGGGGSGSVDQGGTGGQPEPVTIPSLTEMAAPAETVADQDARAGEIISSTTFFHLSPVYGNTTDPDLPAYDSQERSCGSVVGEDMYCEATISDEAASILQTDTWYVEHSDLRLDSGLSNAEAVGTKNGITLMKGVKIEEFDEVSIEATTTTYGAWMEHSAFGVQTVGADVADEGLFITARYAVAGGDRNVTIPAGSATWRGVMVGTPATGADRGDLLQGDATLRYDEVYCPNCDVVPGLDATFDNIKNIDKLRAHSVETVSFTGIPFYAQGTFWTGDEHDFIWGNFYGADHAEAAGIFEKSDIVGAFGAKRQ